MCESLISRITPKFHCASDYFLIVSNGKLSTQRFQYLYLELIIAIRQITSRVLWCIFKKYLLLPYHKLRSMPEGIRRDMGETGQSLTFTGSSKGQKHEPQTQGSLFYMLARRVLLAQAETTGSNLGGGGDFLRK